jgi:NAD(P)-dependent dehydrogenase (short-subunit alcohol dehydrogenase family)
MPHPAGTDGGSVTEPSAATPAGGPGDRATPGDATEPAGQPEDRFARYPSLTGRSVFVSGGATGLGAEFVRQFAAQGSRVSFVDIDAAAGAALCEQVAAAGAARPLFRSADVRDTAGYVAAIEAAAAAQGPIQVLVNNAANDERRASAAVDPAFWADKLAVNVTHHFFASQAVAGAMRTLGGGSIINLGSIAVHVPLTELSAYVAAKAAIEGLTRTLARELGPDRIRVNCVLPGWIMTERQLRDWVTPEAERLVTAAQSLPDKLFPPDVARLVLWLAADDSAACTGQKWIVDGGWV